MSHQTEFNRTLDRLQTRIDCYLRKMYLTLPNKLLGFAPSGHSRTESRILDSSQRYSVNPLSET